MNARTVRRNSNRGWAGLFALLFRVFAVAAMGAIIIYSSADLIDIPGHYDGVYMFASAGIFMSVVSYFLIRKLVASPWFLIPASFGMYAFSVFVSGSVFGPRQQLIFRYFYGPGDYFHAPEGATDLLVALIVLFAAIIWILGMMGILRFPKTQKRPLREIPDSDIA